MKSRMKKLLSMGLVLSMVLALAGCQNEKEQNVANEGTESAVGSSTVATESNTVATESTEVDLYEATEYPESVTVFSSKGASKIKEGEKDYNASTSFRLMEEMTGTHIEWNLQDDFDQKFQLMIAGGEYDDVIVANLAKYGGAEKFVEDGVIINLMDYQEYMPNFIEFTKNNPEIAKSYLSSEGEILYLPFIRFDRELCVFQGPLMRMDWLEKLDLEVPTNPETLYNVLLAFKNQDPNGNGQADEIPMSGKSTITQSFGMFDTSTSFYLKDGKVMYGPMTENYDEALTYFAKLYHEGLIDEEYMMITGSQLTGKVTNHQVGFYWNYQPTTLADTMREVDPNFKMLGIPWFENSEGVSVTSYQPYIQQVVPSWCAAISTQCENPEEVLKWLDSFYSEEATEYMNYGEKGVTYNMVDGKYVYSDYITNNPDHTLSEMTNLEIGSIGGRFPQFQRWEAYAQTISQEGAESILSWMGADTSMCLPSLSFTAEENQSISNIMAQINTIVDEKLHKIIMGQEKLEVMEEVRSQITKLGIEDVIAIYQAAYDRYNNNTFAE